MPKVKVKITMKGQGNEVSNEVIGLYKDNILKYNEPGECSAVFDYDKELLIREDKNARHKLDFKNGIFNIYYKEIHSDMNVNVKIKKTVKNEKDFEVKYEVGNSYEKASFIYRIEELK